ncbi:hypothetical protein J1N35_005591 [Gossypium stocksii]|uniref:Uncharacterized protein n=1 Tax=Gossypium stocksii TaxID=47602 RepID=A0A9D3WEL0_9ROSI|nr:hypothetical protein J1N35_005591 [Gossypium stocksii]
MEMNDAFKAMVMALKGTCEKDHKEDFVDGNGNGVNGSNGKPRVGKKKPNRKRDKLKCFLCDGPHILKKWQKKSMLKEKPVGRALCPKKSIIEGDDRANEESEKLGSSKGKVEANREKMSKKKQVKCFLYRGPHELWNYPKQVVVKGKTTFELGELSEGLPPKEDSVEVGRVIDKASTYGRGGWCTRLQGKRSDASWRVDQNKCKE